MTSKLPAVKGLPCVQNHLTWADASLKPCHTRSFLCQTPQPFSLSSSLAVFFIPSLFRISHMFYNDVQIQQCEKSISLSLFWPLLGSWVFLRLSVSPVGKLDHLGMWTLFRSFFFLSCSFFPFFFSGQTVASQAPLIKSNWLVGCVAWPVTTFWCSARDMWRDRPYLLLRGWHMAPAQLLYSFPFSSPSLP